MKKIYFALLALFALLTFSASAASNGTFLIHPHDLRLTNIRILAERPAADRTEIEFTADVQNTDVGVYEDVTIYVASSNASPSLVIVDFMLQFPDLAASATAVGDAANTLIISVLNAELAAARAAILDGSMLEYTAVEAFVYSGPPKYIDEIADKGFTGTLVSITTTILVFSNNIPMVQSLGKGDLILADPAAGAYRPEGPDAFNSPYLAQYIPFEVDSVVIVGDRTHVSGSKRDLQAILHSGTFIGDTRHAYEGGRDPYDPEVENTYTDEEQAERDLLAAVTRASDPNDAKLAELAGLNAIPIRFNKKRIGQAIDLSGEVLLRSSGLKFEISFRGLELSRAVAHIDAGLVANLVLETVGTNNNMAAPIGEKEIQVLHVALPPVPINIAGIPMSLGGNFSVKVGAEALAPGGLSVPIQSAIFVGAEIGWDGEQAFAAPAHEFIPPHISDPTLFEAMEVTARAWAEAKFELTIGDSLQLLNAGPSLAIRAQGEFTANPFSNPWWNLDFTGELIGAFNLDFLAWNIVGVESNFWSETFAHIDSQGPLIRAAAATKKAGETAAAAAPASSLRPDAGGNARWGVAFQPKPGQAAYGAGFVLPLEGGDVFTAGSSALATFFARFRPDGTLVWCQNFNSIIETVAGVQLRDGRIALLGKGGLDWFVAFYDTNGVQLSFKRYNFGNSIEVSDMDVAYTESGDANLIVVGFKNQTIVTDSDPFICKLDANGEIIWAKILELPGDDEFFAVTALRGGGYVVSGRTDAEIGTDPLMNVAAHGFLTKVNSEGELVWSQAIASRWGMELNDVVEAADGTLFAAGSNGDLVHNYYPSILIAKFAADGSLLHHVLLGEDPDEEDMLPSSGDTPYDGAAQIVWTEDGLYLTGNTGLGTGNAGWVAAVTEELGVKWFSSFDGSRADVLSDIAVTDDGLAVMGWSDSIMPFGTGGQHSVVLLKYPWEGIVRMHPDTGVATSYLQPRTFLSSDDSHFLAVDNTNPDQPAFLKTAPVQGVFQTITWTVKTTAVPIGLTVSPTMARLERIDPVAVKSFADWTAYHQLPSADSTLFADVDGDGRPNVEEFVFGTNPYISDVTPTPIIILDNDGETEVVRIRFEVASWANLPILVRAGSDLGIPLSALTGYTVTDEGPFRPGLRMLKLQVAMQRENQFFQIGVQGP